MNKLPKGWKAKALGEVLKLEYGKPLPKDKRDENGKFPAYGANGIKCRTNQFYWDKPTIIVGRKGSAGEVNLTENKFWPLDVTYFVDFDERQYDLIFLYFCLVSLNIPKLAKGVKPGINRNDVYNIKFVFPSLLEQKRIVSILDEVFAGISKALANAEKNLANARELFESYLNNAFTQKGEGWVEKPLGEIAVLQRGFDLPKRLRSKGNFPLVSSSGIIDTHIFKKVNGPGVVTGRSGSIGNVFFIEQDYWPLNTVLYVKEFYENDPYFVYYLLKQFNLGNYASGAGVPTLNRNNVHKISVSIPHDIAEQRRIAGDLEGLLHKTQHLETIYRKKLTVLTELKQSVLQKAFAGELTADATRQQVQI